MSYLVNATLSYEARNDLKDNEALSAEVEAKFGKDFLGWSERILDQEEVEWCEDRKLKLDIRRIKGMAYQPVADQIKHVTQIAVPNVGLLAIDEVCVREDYCTDALQQDLDDGWRLIAVCPPNSARRPDYILGRTKTSN